MQATSKVILDFFRERNTEFQSFTQFQIILDNNSQKRG